MLFKYLYVDNFIRLSLTDVLWYDVVRRAVRTSSSMLVIFALQFFCVYRVIIAMTNQVERTKCLIKQQ